MDDSIPPPSDIDPPWVEAREQLASLVETSVELRRAMGRLEAHRVVAIHEAIEFAVGRARAIDAPSESPTGQRELARRAVIAELAVAWRVSEYSMQRLAAESFLVCTSLPATLAGLRDGQITAAHVRVIAEAVVGLDAEAAVIAAADAELAAIAASTTPARLRQSAKRVLERLQVDTVTERHERAYVDRSVQLESARDGMAWLAIQMRASDALLIRDRLRGAIGQVLADETESRTCAQLEVDLARDLLLHAVPAGDGETARVLSSIRPSVHVTVPVLTLLGVDDEAGDLDGYGPIDADTARRLAAAAPSLTRLLTDPISGAVLDVDRRSYRVPADLRKWLQVRDGTCRFPGCARRAFRCELDHSKAWAADHGKTAHDNLAHLCAFHHHLKHETSWSVRHLDQGVLEWTSLSGASYRTTPEGNLRPGGVQRLHLDADAPRRIECPDEYVAVSPGAAADATGTSGFGPARRSARWPPARYAEDAAF
jgi:hypothetical protein